MPRKSKEEAEVKEKKLSFFSANAVKLLPYIELKSNREIVIDGCKGIVEYDTEIIRINTGNMVVALTGRGLNIKCLTTSSVVICGFITGIEFVC